MIVNVEEPYREFYEQGHLDFALRIKKRTKLPIIYSGNVNLKNIKERLEQFEFVMIGRNAIGNPNIFSKAIGKVTNFDFFDYLKLAKQHKLKFRVLKFQAMGFTKGIENSTKLRAQIAKAKTIKEIKEVYSNV